MRDILFRGKRKNTGEWIEGFYIHSPEGEGTYDNEQHFIQYIPRHGGLGAGYEVIPETVGQYTGLNDKNGNKIFEGDIVKTPHWNGIIEWDFDASFVVRCVGTFITNNTLAGHSNLEVIGNIHDNPELLGVEK